MTLYYYFNIIFVISKKDAHMTHNHMRIFIEVYRCLNMTRAAEKLNMTQPAVTRAIKEIENYYGIRLFERLNKGLFPTEKAKDIYYRAQAIMEEYNVMEKELKNEDNTGIIRIGASISLGIYMLPPLVKRLNKERPNLKIRVVIENGAALEKKLLSNELDLAFIEGPTSNQNLQRKRIMNDELVVIASPDSNLGKEVSISEFSKEPLLCREKGSISRTYIEGIFMANDLIVDPIWESESSQAIINAVHENIGVSILPEKIVSPHVRTGWIKVVNIKEICLTRRDYIVTHKDKYLSDTIKYIMNIDYQTEYSKTQYIT